MSVLVGPQPEPSCGRGTASILWSCLTTVFLCTWMMLQINVPLARTLFKEKLRFLLLAILWPELYAMIVFDTFIMTWNHYQAVRRLGGDWQGWTLKMSSLCGMGGSGLPLDMAVILPALIKADRQLQQESGGNAPCLLSIDCFPTNRRIDERCRRDSLSKIITILQTIRFAANVFYRLTTPRLSLSLLEVTSAAFVFNGLALFALNFIRPQDLEEPFTCGVDPRQLKKLRKYAEDKTNNIPTSPEFRNSVILYASSAIVHLSFAAIHVAAWNYEFPTMAERTIWRVASTLNGVLVFCIWRPIVFNRGLTKPDGSLLVLGRLLILILRVFLLVESFASLRSAPVGIYLKGS